ncbi:hypothetical protein EYC84_006007 [Monilinia fructicola]|uniref:Uncharacterized protein n=1 Tax=Monilinia fructicola TaxID=38448 RepID=A0A5M9JYE3_MONFR|nr:hypothetical protein EYC84_006007 [Monilinia fructicola]
MEEETQTEQRELKPHKRLHSGNQSTRKEKKNPKHKIISHRLAAHTQNTNTSNSILPCQVLSLQGSRLQLRLPFPFLYHVFHPCRSVSLRTSTCISKPMAILWSPISRTPAKLAIHPSSPQRKLPFPISPSDDLNLKLIHFPAPIPPQSSSYPQ